MRHGKSALVIAVMVFAAILPFAVNAADSAAPIDTRAIGTIVESGDFIPSTYVVYCVESAGTEYAYVTEHFDPPMTWRWGGVRNQPGPLANAWRIALTEGRVLVTTAPCRVMF